MIQYFIGIAAYPWVVIMRSRYRSVSYPLDTKQHEHLLGWFDQELLESVMIARPEKIRMAFESIGRRIFSSSFSGHPRGLCLGRVVLVDHAVQDVLPIVFHELVHTLQWKELGSARFLGKYVHEVTRDGYFHNAGLEEMARTLTDRYNKGGEFNVSDEVQRLLHNAD